MLKPVIVISQMAAEKYEILGTEIFWYDRGFSPVWCAFDTSEINAAAEKSDIFLLIAPEHANDRYVMVCNYLRDLCLDEEKRVYQIGNDETNEIVKKVIPSIFLRGCYQFLEDDPGDVLTGIAKLEKNELEKKGFLIISADVSYCRMLRTALDKDFNVVVSNGPVNDIEPYLKDAYCVLIGLDVKGDFLEMAKLRVLLNKARKKRELHVVLLAETQEQQKEVNRYVGTEGLCFHKESDFVKIAHYLVERYGANPKNREKRSPGSA